MHQGISVCMLMHDELLLSVLTSDLCTCVWRSHLCNLVKASCSSFHTPRLIQFRCLKAAVAVRELCALCAVSAAPLVQQPLQLPPLPQLLKLPNSIRERSFDTRKQQNSAPER